MCIIIHKPSGLKLPRQIAEGGARANPQGGGLIAFYDEGPQMRMAVRRCVPSWGLLEDIEKFSQDSEMVIHFRIKTHGDVNLDNCHPFKIELGNGEAIYVMHNGVLNVNDSSDKSKSDTWHFAHTLLEPILQKHPELRNSDPFWYGIEDLIGSNKVVIVDPLYGVRILNAHLGDWIGKAGLWVSNKSYLYAGGYHQQSSNVVPFERVTHKKVGDCDCVACDEEGRHRTLRCSTRNGLPAHVWACPWSDAHSSYHQQLLPRGEVIGDPLSAG